MSERFENGKFYRFYKNLWKGIGEIGSLRRVKDSYDIIIDLCKGYYLKLEKGWTNDFSVIISLNFYYSYGYKNINQATIEGVKMVDTSSVCETIEKINYFRYLSKKYVKEHKNNRDYMLIVQEKDARMYY